MSAVQKFEDLEAWRRGRELVRLIYEASAHGEMSRDFALRDQIRRAAVSVVSNIAEGFGRGGNREFRQFLSQASGSIAEVKSQLYVALDAGFIDQKQFSHLYRLANETGQLIGGLLRSLGESSLRGAKFKTPEAD